MTCEKPDQYCVIPNPSGTKGMYVQNLCGWVCVEISSATVKKVLRPPPLNPGRKKYTTLTESVRKITLATVEISAPPPKLWAKKVYPLNPDFNTHLRLNTLRYASPEGLPLWQLKYAKNGRFEALRMRNDYSSPFLAL